MAIAKVWRADGAGEVGALFFAHVFTAEDIVASASLFALFKALEKLKAQRIASRDCCADAVDLGNSENEIAQAESCLKLCQIIAAVEVGEIAFDRLSTRHTSEF